MLFLGPGQEFEETLVSPSTGPPSLQPTCLLPLCALGCCPLEGASGQPLSSTVSNSTGPAAAGEQDDREVVSRDPSQAPPSANAISDQLQAAGSSSSELASNDTANSIFVQSEPKSSLLGDRDSLEGGEGVGIYLELSTDRLSNSSSEAPFSNSSLPASAGNRTHKAR